MCNTVSVKDDLQSDSLVLRTHLVAGSQPLEDLLTRVAELVRSRLHRRGPPRLQSASRLGPQTRFSCMWRTTLPGLVAGLRPERGSVSANAGACGPERSVGEASPRAVADGGVDLASEPRIEIEPPLTATDVCLR